MFGTGVVDDVLQCKISLGFISQSMSFEKTYGAGDGVVGFSVDLQ